MASTDTLIVVAHKGGARLVEEKDEALTVTETLVAEGGRESQRGGDDQGSRAPAPRESQREHASVVFAGELADRLRALRLEQRYGELVLIAAPRFLGMIRDALDHATAGTVRGTLDKDFGRLPDRDLVARLEKL